MTDYDLILRASELDPNDYAVASFLARHRGMTLRATGRTCWRFSAGAPSGN